MTGCFELDTVPVLYAVLLGGDWYDPLPLVIGLVLCTLWASAALVDSESAVARTALCRASFGLRAAMALELSHRWLRIPVPALCLAMVGGAPLISTAQSRKRGVYPILDSIAVLGWMGLCILGPRPPFRWAVVLMAGLEALIQGYALWTCPAGGWVVPLVRLALAASAPWLAVHVLLVSLILAAYLARLERIDQPEVDDQLGPLWHLLLSWLALAVVQRHAPGLLVELAITARVVEAVLYNNSRRAGKERRGDTTKG